jgi:hypothetical protein
MRSNVVRRRWWGRLRLPGVTTPPPKTGADDRFREDRIPLLVVSVAAAIILVCVLLRIWWELRPSFAV